MKKKIAIFILILLTAASLTFAQSKPKSSGYVPVQSFLASDTSY